MARDDANQLPIVHASAPEPGTLALAAIGIASLGWVAHRRRAGATVVPVNAGHDDGPEPRI